MDSCKNIFDPEGPRTGYVSQILVAENSIVAKTHDIMRDRMQNLFAITVFILVSKGTREVFLKKNCEVWAQEKATVLLFVPKGFMVHHACVNVPRFDVETLESRAQEATANGRPGDWFLVQDAHDVITVPPNIAQPFQSVRHMLNKASTGPDEFNAVSVSTLYMTRQDGSTFPKGGMPFMVHSPSPWDQWTKKTHDFRPLVDTLQNGVRAWQQTDSTVSISRVKTLGGNDVIGTITFPGRRVYPYSLVSMRYKPDSNASETVIGRLDEKTYKMNGYFLFLGYWNYARRAMLETRVLY